MTLLFVVLAVAPASPTASAVAATGSSGSSATAASSSLPSTVDTASPSATASAGSSDDATGQAAAAWSVVPAGSGAAGIRSALVHEVSPGQVVSDSVLVTNYSAVPLDLDLAALDALTTTDGGYDLVDDQEESVGVGAWTALGTGHVTLAARSRVEVPVTVSVPQDAEPGDHAGGVVAILTGTDADGSHEGGQVLVHRRVGVRLYLRVAGDASTSLAVQILDVAYEDPVIPFTAGTATVTYLVHNTGTLRAGFSAQVKVQGPWGLAAVVDSAPEVDQVLPDGRVTLVRRIGAVFPLVREDVTVVATALVPPASDLSGDQEGDPVDGAVPATASGVLWAPPWADLLVVLLLVLTVVELMRRHRRRRGTDPDDPTTATDSAPVPDGSGTAARPPGSSAHSGPTDATNRPGSTAHRPPTPTPARFPRRR